VWETFARNYEIRSPKEVMGADLGLPSLTIQSFYEAKHGADAWTAIKRIPRLDWMDYLRWYRRTADLPIENDVRVTDIDFDRDGVTLTTDTGRTIRTRLAVLATGMDGGGAWSTPAIITRNLPPDRYNHSCEVFDDQRLDGLDIGILGAGAAAFDMAVTALTAGAQKVDMFMRRPVLPTIDVAREFETAGQLNHGHELSDQTKWGLSRFMSGLSQAPAEHHFHKACSFPNFRMHLGSPWEAVTFDGEKIRIETPRDDFSFDHVFSATGVSVDMNHRPELRKLAAGAALWRDRFTPPADDPAPGRLNFPYLDRDYRFMEREPGTAPGIERIFAFNALASLSMGGMSAVSISSHKFGVPRIASGVTGFLFREQEDQLIPTLASYDKPGIEIPAHVREMLGMAPEPMAQAG
jgi:cation diffusion facilitator CzcD-associated flavoprotein CzcO